MRSDSALAVLLGGVAEQAAGFGWFDGHSINPFGCVEF
jgi:hypothetical protein